MKFFRSLCQGKNPFPSTTTLNLLQPLSSSSSVQFQNSIGRVKPDFTSGDVDSVIHRRNNPVPSTDTLTLARPFSSSSSVQFRNSIGRVKPDFTSGDVDSVIHRRKNPVPSTDTLKLARPLSSSSSVRSQDSINRLKSRLTPDDVKSAIHVTIANKLVRPFSSSASSSVRFRDSINRLKFRLTSDDVKSVIPSNHTFVLVRAYSSSVLSLDFTSVESVIHRKIVRSFSSSSTSSVRFHDSISRLKPGFTSEDVESVIRSQSDPSLAMDVFRWSSLRLGHRQPAFLYRSLLEISIAGRNFAQIETLIDEILAGACQNPDLPLFNLMIEFCVSKKHLFNKSFDIFKKMQKISCRPDLETFNLLLKSVLMRFGKPSVSYVYLQSVRSLNRQMRASGVIPDVYALNLIIKAYCICLEMDDAIKIFNEMGLYGCDPNKFTYGYLCKGLCEKGRIDEGLGFFREMREKDLVPTKSVYSILVCGLAMERRFSEGVGVLRDMLEERLVPDLLTYRTLLECLYRDGKADVAFKLLEELRGLEGCMSQKTYSNLLDGLHWLCQ